MAVKKRILTGITTTGTPHLGNLVGAILPAIEASKGNDTSSFLFLADYLSLIKKLDSSLTHESSFEIDICVLHKEFNNFFIQDKLDSIQLDVTVDSTEPEA